MTDNRPILVVPATGKTGRRVAARLDARGVPVRRASRTGPGAVALDWDDPSSWAPALDGARAAYAAYVPDLAIPGADAVLGAFAAAARSAGLERLVLLSGRGEPGALAAEHAAARGGIPLTVVRCSWFAQNFTESFLRDAVLAGELRLPVADVPEPFVDADDIAEVAVAALLGPGHEGEVYELTGPQALTFAEVADAITAASGRQVAFRSVTADAFADGLAADDVPPEVAQLLLHLFCEVLDGRNAATADGVQRALGRAPRPFAAFAADAAAAGAWT